MSNKIEGQTYWRSLNELANNKSYQQFLHREFPENGSELPEGQSRRHFLKIMGASVALAGLAACRKPVQKILPYTKRPEDIIPGNPNFYASALPLMGSLNGVLVESSEGRPTKIEGNPDHPGTLGGSSIHQQASILDLYDPDRSRKVLKNGADSSWDEFVSFCASTFSSDKKIAVISEASSSQTLARLKKDAEKKFKTFTWASYEAFGEYALEEGNALAFGKKLRTVNHFDKASVIVSFESDFLNDPVNSVRNSKAFAKARKLLSTKDSMNRLYALESFYSVTGSNADHRLALTQANISAFVMALAGALSSKVSGLSEYAGVKNEFSTHSWMAVLTEELLSNSSSSLLVGSALLPAEVNATIALMNKALGNVSKTVTYHELPEVSHSTSEVASLLNDVASGNYDALILLGTNIAYTLPKDAKVEQALKAVPSVHLALHVDETSKLATWHINRAHFLEMWGDGAAYTGEASIIQPLIQPLFGGKSEIEVLSAIVTGTSESSYSLVQNTWKGMVSGGFISTWNKALHDGVISKSSFKVENVKAQSKISRQAIQNLSKGASSLEVVVRADNKVLDGRFANNGWLQELPDPVTKITWDNVAIMSASTGASYGLDSMNEDNKVPFITVKANGSELSIPAWILPGHPDNNITVFLGYGREGVGRIASSYEFDDFQRVGFDVNPLRSIAEPYHISNPSVSMGVGTYKIACTQDHHSMEGRALVRFANLDEYRKKPTFAPDMVKTPGVKEGEQYAEPIFTPYESPDYQPQWGMSIDLNACTGCGVCTIACQAENNIPVIGKKEVSRGREMHWIRVDRYFVGEEESPKMVHQPIPCMHCELAPCEQVCPVAATTHSDDGLNQMTYNRCIGTRYCANNCPYKVRRFNFFNYAKEYLTTGDDPEIVQMAQNPEVTIRFRGVMEKCTYCVQRINRAKIETKRETNSRKPADGTVLTACQQACPSDAIYFGDLTDKNSVVSKMKQNERDYRLLDELNTRPRTSYMARITNQKV